MSRKLSTFKRSALAGLSAVAILGAALAPIPAFAQPTGGTTPQGCPVVDEHGNVSHVAPGTVIGLFHCGTDGQWHFGWFVS